MNLNDRYFLRLAAAFVRGKALQEECNVPPRLLNPTLYELSASECDELFDLGLQSGLKLHKFKRAAMLPRVRRTLGALQGLAPTELLDIGSGRGVFLWPLLDTFPDLTTTAIDSNPLRASDLHAVFEGGVTQLDAHEMDVAELTFESDAFDVVTMLEVLEHIPKSHQAISNLVRVCRRAIVLSVPSKEDDNPEHIHLFNEQSLRELFRMNGVERVGFEYVPGHIIAVATKK